MSNGVTPCMSLRCPTRFPVTTRWSWLAGIGARAAVDNQEVLRNGRSRPLEEGEARPPPLCTGAYLLAAAGLLDNRRATTHWRFCDDLAGSYPHVQLDPDPVFLRDGDIPTSAGVTAGMDLTLSLLEEDLGPEVALAVARDAGCLPQASRRAVAVQRSSLS